MKPNKSTLKLVLKIVLTIIALVIVLSYIDFGQIYGSLKIMEFSFFFLALALMPVFVALKSYRWYYILKHKTDVKYTDAIASYLAGNFIGLFTPARAGELSRVLYLPVKDRLKLAGLVVIDKVFDVFALILLSCIGSYLLIGLELTALLVLLLIVFTIGLLSIKKLSTLLAMIPVINRLKILSQMADIATMKPKTLIWCILVSVVLFLVAMVQCYLLVRSFCPIDFIIVLFTFPIIILTNILPITIGGLGIREGASVFLLTKFGVAEAAAFNSSLLLFFIDTLIPDLAGALIISRLPELRNNEHKVTALVDNDVPK